MNRKARTLLAAFDGLAEGTTVVEIGCARFAHEVPSDGWSTVYLAAEAAERGWELHSVDISEAAIRVARNATAGRPITLHHSDGEAWLYDFGQAIDGLYLDGSANPAEALAQYEAARLADNATVAIDDVQTLGGLPHGKGNLLLDRLRDDGFTVEIVDTHPDYKMAVAQR